MHAQAYNNNARASVTWREYDKESAAIVAEEEAEEVVEVATLMIGAGLEIRGHHRDGGDLLRL